MTSYQGIYLTDKDGVLELDLIELGTLTVLPTALVDSSGNPLGLSGNPLYVQTSSAVLPTGAATAALQETGNASLASIDAKTPSLGQALAASSVPVVLTAAQLTTLTPLSSVAVTNAGTFAVQASQSGTWNVGTVTTITNVVHVDDNSGSLTVDGTVAATQSGTWNIGTLTSITDVVHIDDNSSTISIDDGGGVITVDGTVGVSGTVTVDSELTTADLDTGVGTDTRAVVGLVGSKSGGGELIPGDATNGLLVNLGTNNDVTVSSGTIDTITNVVHIDDNASSITVDGTVAATQSGTWNITNISGTISLPTGAATAAKQPALGTAGTASADVITIQGIASMTAVKVDGSAVTQPVSGTFWQATQPVSLASVPSHAVTNAGTFAVQNTPVAPTTIYNGKKTVTTAGTRVTLASSQAVKSVVIKALVGNTGVIYVGDSSVASTNGFALQPGDVVSLDIADLATVNLDSSVNGEGVTYIATN